MSGPGSKSVNERTQADWDWELRSVGSRIGEGQERVSGFGFSGGCVGGGGGRCVGGYPRVDRGKRRAI